jgi:riboflavin synthase
MFTGIITAIGTISAIDQRGDLRLTVQCPAEFLRGVAVGASIACSGVCLTVVTHGPDWFAVDVSGETQACTAQGLWQLGARLNLERALKVGDELGGHIVTGHVDGVGEIIAMTPQGDSQRTDIGLPADLAAFVAAKGSITVDGISLTVNAVHDQVKGAVFSLNIIPHTAAHTTAQDWRPGQQVNLEIDILARYLQRMASVKEQA